MSTLRARAIRLANENPDLQPLLLPILAEDAPSRMAADAKGKKPVEGTAIRSGYYESGDKIGALESAVLDFQDKGVAGALRLSPHYYNTHDEVEAAVAALRQRVTG